LTGYQVVINQYRSIISPNLAPTIIPAKNVTARTLDDTTLNLGFGGEYYLLGSAGPRCLDTRCRVGFDAGARYGTSKLILKEIPHKTGTVGGFFLSLHSDVEVPCGNVIFFAGIRTEYGILYSDILQKQTDADMQTFTALFSVGMRF
jgi:hypothetical protein